MVTETIAEVFGVAGAPPALQKVPVEKRAFGDFQCNAAMSLSKQVGGSKPRDVAVKLVEAFEVKFKGLFETPTIGGPGFINLKLTREYVNHQVRAVSSAVLWASPGTYNLDCIHAFVCCSFASCGLSCWIRSASAW